MQEWLRAVVCGTWYRKIVYLRKKWRNTKRYKKSSALLRLKKIDKPRFGGVFILYKPQLPYFPIFHKIGSNSLNGAEQIFQPFLKTIFAMIYLSQHTKINKYAKTYQYRCCKLTFVRKCDKLICKINNTNR